MSGKRDEAVSAHCIAGIKTMKVILKNHELFFDYAWFWNVSLPDLA
jgi:hypothetical protein